MLVLAAPGTPERRVADAMRAHPEWTSGTSRDERKLMDAVPGLLIKGGAEGVDAFALTDGRAGAVKIDDGAHRGRTPVTVAALRLLGVAVPAELATVPVIGGGAEVGVIRAAGLTAAIISAVQFGLGLALTATSAPGPAHLLYSSVDRLDGAKMLALAVFAAAAATMTVLPRWLRWTGIALAVTIACSGLVYLLLVASLAAAAGPALVLLLVFMTGCGIIIGMTAGPRER
jgi:hypothetical protein